MLKIGEFSLAGRVSVRTLRLYDEIGLLPPARVDPESGYRRYSVQQLPRLHRTRAVRDLGLSLDEIAESLAHGAPQPDHLRAMLERKRAEVGRTIAEEHARLARIEARLDQLDRIDQEDPMHGYDIVLKPVPAQRVAAIRETLPAYPAVGSLFAEIGVYLAEQRLRPGAFTAVWHCPEFQERDVDGEAAVAVDENAALPAHPRVRVEVLPAVEQMACTIHHGPLAALDRAYAALSAWLEATDSRVAGPTREVYHRGGPDQHDLGYVTEIQFPVAKF